MQNQTQEKDLTIYINNIVYIRKVVGFHKRAQFVSSTFKPSGGGGELGLCVCTGFAMMVCARSLPGETSRKLLYIYVYMHTREEPPV